MPERRTLPSGDRMAENRTLPLQRIRVWRTRTLPSGEKMRERPRPTERLRPTESRSPTLEETHRPTLPGPSGWRILIHQAGRTKR